jgi:hypothetical protein
MKLKKYSQLFEADIKKTLPEDYIQDVRRRAEPYMGGPSRQDMMNAMRLMQDIFNIQRGNEKKLTEIGEEIILNHYGRMLEDISLDIKIVEPFDEEKLKMTQKMQEDNQDGGDDGENDEVYPSYETPIEVPQEDIDRRKIINNIMQGEAQNVHSMMYTAKDEIDKIDDLLLDMYTRHLEINRKFDWDENRPDMSEMMAQHPEMANAMETNYEGEEGEEGEFKPVIKVRALDLPMLIHETVKGIYELMSHKVIPEDKTMAEALLKLTDTLEDEEEDIKYGPFIAADIRDYINSYLQRKESKDVQTIPNLREFIFSGMMDLSANKFVELIKNILMKNIDDADKVLGGKDGLVSKAILNATDEVIDDISNDIHNEEDEEDTLHTGHEGEESDIDKLVRQANEKEPEQKSEDLSKLGQAELNFQLNKAMDEGNWTRVKEISKFLKTKE